MAKIPHGGASIIASTADLVASMGGLGYSFGWGDVIGVWRYLDYDMKSGSRVESMNFNGPAIAMAFHW